MFIELHALSNFSFLTGASHPEELVDAAAALHYPGVGIADIHTLGGVVRAHDAACEAKIRYVLGARVLPLTAIPQQVPDSDPTREHLAHDVNKPRGAVSLCLFPQTLKGYHRLCSLLSLGKSRAPKGACYLLLEDVLSENQDLCVTAFLDRPHDPACEAHLAELCNVFGPNLSLALLSTYSPGDQERQQRVTELSRRYDIPLVATNAVLFHLAQRRMLADVLTCIRLRITLPQAGHALLPNAERYLKSPAEMEHLFRHQKSALFRSVEIFERTSGFSLAQLRYEYPEEICPDDKTPQAYLEEITWRCAGERYPTGIPPALQALLMYELRLIAELDYAKYFLTVYDIVEFASSRGILCQGRGAAANSAVCYVLGITSVPPDKIKLLFERFISKERNEPPDIDIDFEHERREEVIQYIYAKYGRQRAALVSEIISYRRRSAFRDVATAFALSPQQQDELRPCICRNDPEQWPEVIQQRCRPENHKQFLLVAGCIRPLLSFPRHRSQHVGGFVISGPPLSQLVPIENAAMEDRTVIEWDKDDVDRMGMLKIDVLGLGMLTCIRKAFELLQRHQSQGRSSRMPLLQLFSVPEDDPRVYEMITRADTIGVFQIESRAQMNMLPRLRPQRFYDLVIEVAIVRPGPIQGGMVHPYLRRRQGKEAVRYPNEQIRNILGTTLGVPIFQEQVMELAIVAAGFTPGESDQLRRAIASWRKKEGLLKKFHQRLVSGMLERGYDKEFAEQVFLQIQGFAEYGFPQSHSASFALLVYISAWLKFHHPAVFAAALLNSQPMGFYQPSQIVRDAEKHNVEVRPVDINCSEFYCTLEGQAPALRLGFRLVGGVARRDVEEILRARSQRRFSSLRDVWRRTQLRSGTLRLLAKADAFRSLGIGREQALWTIASFRDEVLPLLENIRTEDDHSPLPPLSTAQHVSADYSHTGLSLKGHPVALLREQLRERGFCTAADLRSGERYPAGRVVQSAGMVIVRQQPMTSSGVIFLTLEDETGFLNYVVKPELFRRQGDLICSTPLLGVRARIQREGEVIQLLALDFENLSNDWEILQGLSRDFH